MINIKMKNIVTMLFSGMALVELSESLKEKVHFSKWLQNMNDGTSSLRTFEWMVKVSIKECVDACKSTKACEYINFEVRSRKCALIREQQESDDRHHENVELKPGYVFGNKSEWDIKEFTECVNCGSYGKCPIDGWLESSKNICRNSGCRTPRSDGFYGNIFSSGSRIRLSCADGYAIFRCSENGTWVEDKSQMCILSFFNGSYYFLQPLNMSWFKAKSHCEEMSAHLVDINTEQEQLFLKDWLNDTNEHIIWIGDNDLVNEGYFMWPDGSAVVGYIHWHSGNPNDYEQNQDCIALFRLLSPGRLWNDLGCDTEYQSICEFH